jgi:spore coat protein A
LLSSGVFLHKMTDTRREFLSKLSACVIFRSSNQIGAKFPRSLAGQNHAMMHTPVATAPPLIQPSTLVPFVDPLPIPVIAKPNRVKHTAGRPAPGQFYRLKMSSIVVKVHRDIPETTVWVYGDSFPGPTIEARREKPVQVEWVNDLPEQHFLPIDTTLCGAERGNPEVRAVVHLHGGRVPPESDGYPESWYPPGKSATYSYPNAQDAAMLWYHDHAMGIERLNLYAGLFGAYIIRDDEEDALNLPRGKYEVPLMLSDRMIRKDGQLYYPASRDPEGPWVSEVFGDCFLVNGKLMPYFEVEPRRYRFRILNASNARFFRLTLDNRQSFHQIGTDQGLLAAPIEARRLQLAPGERADVIVDFSESVASTIVLRNDILPLVQFRVSGTAARDPNPLPTRLREFVPVQEKEAVVTRTLTLNEYDNLIGKPSQMLLNGSRWKDLITEKPRHGSVEIWELINLTADTHPIHLHQVRFQVLDRRPISVPTYLSDLTLSYLGPAVSPMKQEAGWKDTVRVESRGITRIAVRFDGHAGRFVWHCHILEHAANEMMRPYEIIS